MNSKGVLLFYKWSVKFKLCNNRDCQSEQSEDFIFVFLKES
jgi:hypothetical protein